MEEIGGDLGAVRLVQHSVACAGVNAGGDAAVNGGRFGERREVAQEAVDRVAIAGKQQDRHIGPIRRISSLRKRKSARRYPNVSFLDRGLARH